MNKIIDSLRDDLEALRDAGIVTEETLCQFDNLHLPPIRNFSPGDIRELREKLQISQPTLANHLHITPLTVRRWETGKTRPTGPALKLLNIIADKGLRGIL